MDLLIFTLVNLDGNWQGEYKHSTTLVTSAGQMVRITGATRRLWTPNPNGTGQIPMVLTSAEPVAEHYPFYTSKVSTDDLTVVRDDDVAAKMKSWAKSKRRIGFNSAHRMYAAVPDELLLEDAEISKFLNKYRERPIDRANAFIDLMDFIRDNRTVNETEESTPFSDDFLDQMAQETEAFTEDWRSGFNKDLFFFDNGVPNPIRTPAIAL